MADLADEMDVIVPSQRQAQKNPTDPDPFAKSNFTYDPDTQAIFRRRKEKLEHPFGHIKRNLYGGYFLLRGLAGVRAEMSLLASALTIFCWPDRAPRTWAD